jgi:D-alanine transaminase
MSQDDSTIYLNGSYLPRSQGSLSIDDRGFIFGDGVYEVFRAVDGELFQGRAHVTRLLRGLDALGIQIPGEVEDPGLLAIARSLLARNRHDTGQATIYLQVTRGAAPRTHHFPTPSVPPTILLYTSTFRHPEGLHEKGARCVLHSDRRWSRADIKSVNLLPNVLAKEAARKAGATEALFVRDGMLLEGSSTNLFGVLDGVLRTYPPANYILRGITRDVVLDLAAGHGIPTREEGIPMEELPRVSELFITGTTTDVLPVIQVDETSIGKGRPGPVTRRLQRALQEEMLRTGTPTG